MVMNPGTNGGGVAAMTLHHWRNLLGDKTDEEVIMGIRQDSCSPNEMKTEERSSFRNFWCRSLWKFWWILLFRLHDGIELFETSAARRTAESQNVKVEE